MRDLTVGVFLSKGLSPKQTNKVLSLLTYLVSLGYIVRVIGRRGVEAEVVNNIPEDSLDLCLPYPKFNGFYMRKYIPTRQAIALGKRVYTGVKLKPKCEILGAAMHVIYGSTLKEPASLVLYSIGYYSPIVSELIESNILHFDISTEKGTTLVSEYINTLVYAQSLALRPTIDVPEDYAYEESVDSEMGGVF